jgi:hypothetical protein
MAHPVIESSTVAAKPPCTPPRELIWRLSALTVNLIVPLSSSAIRIGTVSAMEEYGIFPSFMARSSSIPAVSLMFNTTTSFVLYNDQAQLRTNRVAGWPSAAAPLCGITICPALNVCFRPGGDIGVCLCEDDLMTSFADCLTIQVRAIGRQTTPYSDSFFPRIRT